MQQHGLIQKKLYWVKGARHKRVYLYILFLLKFRICKTNQ